MTRTKEQMLPTRISGSSLVGIGDTHRPVSFGNYCYVGNPEWRIYNMWMENIEAAEEKFRLGGRMKCLTFEDGHHRSAVVIDSRIPKDWKQTELCFTGYGKPPLDVFDEYMAALGGDPEGQREQFTNPKAYWERRGWTYNEKTGTLSRVIRESVS